MKKSTGTKQIRAGRVSRLIEKYDQEIKGVERALAAMMALNDHSDWVLKSAVYAEHKARLGVLEQVVQDLNDIIK